MKLTGRDGELRIYDSKSVIAGSVQANMSVFVYDASGPTFTDKTSEAYADDTNYTGAFWADTNDKIYVGCKTKFAMIQFLSGGGVLAVDPGDASLTAKYYNGTEWVVLTGVVDGTAVGTVSMAQDGNITFKIPIDWALRGDASLSALHYYIELAPAAYPSDATPSADILAPIDGQYLVVKFSNMDYNAPIGRPKTEELIVMDRNKTSSDMHYIEGGDDVIYEPLPVTFSFMLDDAANKTYIFTALECGNPNTGQWTATGVTSKGTTKNDGTNLNPAFKDATKKAVNIQVLFTGGTYAEGWSLYEVFFPLQEQAISESDEGISVNCSGAIYGLIERIHAFGVRY